MTYNKYKILENKKNYKADTESKLENAWIVLEVKSEVNVWRK